VVKKGRMIFCDKFRRGKVHEGRKIIQGLNQDKMILHKLFL
jgi:hypothetical protein